MDHAIFRLHHGAAGSINVRGSENAELFEPKTLRNLAPMSENAHLGHAGPGGHDAMPVPVPSAAGKSGNFTPSAPTSDPRTLFAQTGTDNNPQVSGDTVIKMLPGSGIWKKGPMKTFGPTAVTIKAGQTVTFVNTDFGMAHSVFGEKGEFVSPMLTPGATFTTKPFDQKGVIHFQCAPHPWMKGTITVR